jgi:hypothetical protein
MAINQNHLFEDIDGVRCAVVEKNCKPERVDFLKSLLELNGYTVIVVGTLPPKVAVPKVEAPVEGTASVVEAPPPPPPPPPPTTFTVYVTDNVFNVTNAIFGRLLHTRDGHVVTMKYWKQQETVSNDAKPYFAKTWR